MQEFLRDNAASPAVLEALVNFCPGLKQDTDKESKWVKFLVACARNDLDKVTALHDDYKELDLSCEPLTVSNDCTVFHIAAARNAVDIIDFLIGQGLMLLPAAIVYNFSTVSSL